MEGTSDGESEGMSLGWSVGSIYKRDEISKIYVSKKRHMSDTTALT